MAHSVTLRLPERLIEGLEKLARRTESSKTRLVTRAVEAYLVEQEDYRMALERWKDEKDPVISGAELRRRLARKG